MKQVTLTISATRQLTSSVYEMTLEGDTSAIARAGQFVDVAIEGLFLRRPISVCDYTETSLTLVYKVVGQGTQRMSKMTVGTKLDVLTGLGNGYDTRVASQCPLLVGGGVGVPPLYRLAKDLLSAGKKVNVLLGFNKREEIFYADKFAELGCKVVIATADGSVGVKGFVTDALLQIEFDYIYACGPLPMLRALCDATTQDGQFSFEERMGCGYGVCMGCSCQTKNGPKRICKEGPVLKREEIIW